jgi:hypothetical protein
VEHISKGCRAVVFVVDISSRRLQHKTATHIALRVGYPPVHPTR